MVEPSPPFECSSVRFLISFGLYVGFNEESPGRYNARLASLRNMPCGWEPAGSSILLRSYKPLSHVSNVVRHEPQSTHVLVHYHWRRLDQSSEGGRRVSRDH